MELDKLSMHNSLYPIGDDEPILVVKDKELILRMVEPVLSALGDTDLEQLTTSNWLIGFLYIAESNYLLARKSIFSDTKTSDCLQWCMEELHKRENAEERSPLAMRASALSEKLYDSRTVHPLTDGLVFIAISKELTEVYAKMKFCSDKLGMQSQPRAKLPQIVDRMRASEQSYNAHTVFHVMIGKKGSSLAYETSREPATNPELLMLQIIDSMENLLRSDDHDK